MTRRVALVDVMAGERRAVHTSGFPLDPEKMLPVADVLLLIGDDKGGVMLFRYTAHGEMGGDTPHDTVRQAEDQALFEYGDALMPWFDVPDDVKDAHYFAVKYAAEQLNERDG